MAETDTTSAAQGRFTVAIPKELGEIIDKIGKDITAAVAKATGVEFELTRAQVVQSLIKSAADRAASTAAAK